jgi:uncharacterized protein (TIGR00725 family)
MVKNNRFSMIIPKTKYRKIQVGVIGDSSSTEEQKNIAFRLGRQLAKKGVAVICGGRSGIMKAVSKGVSEEGGLVIGILPSDDGRDANEYLTLNIPTNMGFSRNFIVPMASDVVIVLGGKVGTLNEMSFAWMWGKPIISLVYDSFDPDSWGIKLAGKKLDNRRTDQVHKAESVDEAIDLALDLALNKPEESLFPEKSP